MSVLTKLENNESVCRITVIILDCDLDKKDNISRLSNVITCCRNTLFGSTAALIEGYHLKYTDLCFIREKLALQLFLSYETHNCFIGVIFTSLFSGSVIVCTSCYTDCVMQTEMFPLVILNTINRKHLNDELRKHRLNCFLSRRCKQKHGIPSIQ